MKISRNAMIIMAVLVVAIALAYFTGPKPHSMKKPPGVISQQDGMAGMDGESPETVSQPPMPQVVQEEGGNEAPAAPPQPAVAAISLPPPQGSDLDLLQERYGRDNPFAPLFDTREMPAPVAHAAPAPVTFTEFPELRPVLAQVSAPPDFKLTAIAVRSGQGIAVIDGEILRTGDDIGDFTVLSIKPDQVVLRGKYGEKFALKLKQEFRGAFDTSKNEITNINVKKTPVRSIAGPSSNSSGSYLPGPLPPLPDYYIPGPDDFQTEPLPQSGKHP